MGVQAYQDDTYLVGNDLEVAEAMDTFSDACASMNLHVNFSKSSVLGSPGCAPSASTAEGRDSKAEDGLVVLGSPVGSVAFVHSFLRDKAQEHKHSLDNLKKALGDHLQAAYQILSYCICPKYKHLARTVPPTLLENFAAEHDSRLRKFVKDVFDLPLVHWRSVQIQLHLPLRAAGIGLASLEDIMPLGYYASWVHCGSNVRNFFATFRPDAPKPQPELANDLSYVVGAAKCLLGEDELPVVSTAEFFRALTPQLQGRLTAALADKRFKALLDDVDSVNTLGRHP